MFFAVIETAVRESIDTRIISPFAASSHMAVSTAPSLQAFLSPFLALRQIKILIQRWHFFSIYSSRPLIVFVLDINFVVESKYHPTTEMIHAALLVVVASGSAISSSVSHVVTWIWIAAA
ncbi:hypothetical protein E4T38_01200 [Aureobasidium subglaciale]|nr:hypothetical protein E4T38_01200 [Aureobasidium subglaciale]KAI5230348.1 hypothetical protein E4T40_01201 [Aureobasidium subglaciale]KAI5233527.1 hypothetical protein E4T41_01199 [Aureobasidium subglaciale]KAI5266899.1 hypothetical protein E4T46_01199 [Aureobasidium subglaciale]